MTAKGKSSSLFDDIFKIQNAAPELDVDPEDLVDGFKASLVDGVDEVETFASSSLRKQAAIIPDDPKYKGKKISRKDFFNDDDSADEGHFTDSSQSQRSDDSENEGSHIDDDDFDEEENGEGNDKLESSEDDDDADNDEAGVDDALEDESAKTIKAIDVLPPANKSDDRAKGKAVMYQLGVWDDLIKSRIAMQKMVTACNRLPQPDTWTDFIQQESFRKEAKNVHSSVRKLVSTLLDVQLQLLHSGEKSGKSKTPAGGSDEEITSESEVDDEKEKAVISTKMNGSHNDTEKGDLNADEEDDSPEEEEDEDMETDAVTENRQQNHGRMKRKLDVEEVEETLSKRHKDFQSFRNDTLSKWDEKTRLTQGKIKAKNFSAFEVSVLKQIEQILVNRDRLIKRLHQQRSAYRILGKPSNDTERKAGENGVVEDDDDEVEIKLKQRTRPETEVNHEIIDDNDFYHVCLRDLIEMKQNEETDPVMANKQWLEIQRLRNKQKRKVDTRASKGRKIRYHVKEKLKNYMTPYDKSLWSEEQKDDLFKALFGGKLYRESNPEAFENPSINLGI
ncbi:unnamed protein product [Candidula unifasciata]|uniref:Protein AATF n=1 Tax=Candidula unifasciata TaxID=100452 RepID=A0A8S3ZYA0_9EUPU|nr:unnamed protein product [Candidula unifasciata]